MTEMLRLLRKAIAAGRLTKSERADWLWRLLAFKREEHSQVVGEALLFRLRELAGEGNDESHRGSWEWGGQVHPTPAH